MSPKSITRLVGLAGRAEVLGYEGFFFADSHLNALDPFQASAVVSQHTERLRFGTAVANMVFRDPTLLAGSAASVSAISQGRFVLGLGTGDGTTYRLGRRPTRMADFAAGTALIRALMRGERMDGPAGPVSFQLDGFVPPPVYLGVEGPGGLHAAGQVADGVILGGGFDLHLLDRSLELIDEGARSVGRSVDDLDLVAAGMVAVGDDGDAAREVIKPRIANRAHHNFRHSLDSVPAEHVDEVRHFLDSFDLNKPIDERAPAHAIGPYLASRFSIAGTPAECVDRIRQIEQRGIRHFMLTPHSAHFEATMEALSLAVLPGTEARPAI